MSLCPPLPSRPLRSGPPLSLPVRSAPGRPGPATSPPPPRRPGPARPAGRRLLAALAALASLAAPAGAHGPTPQKVEAAVEVAVPPDAAWALVGDFAGYARWHPGLRSSEADRGNQAGSTRTLVWADGGRAAEELDELDAARRVMSYRSGRELDPRHLPLSSYTARLRVLPQGAGSRIEWTARGYRADTGNDPAAGRDDASAVRALRAHIEPALARAKALLEAR